MRGRLYYFITAILAAIAVYAQIFGMGQAGWNLSAKLRMTLFRSTLRHDIEWFDEEKHSVCPVRHYRIRSSGRG